MSSGRARGSDGQVLLVSSSGGVMLDLLALRGWWERLDRRWLVVDAPDTRDALAGERVEHTAEMSPTSVPGLVVAVRRQWALLGEGDISLVITAGSGAAVPVFIAARMRGIPCLWLETRNVLTAPGLAARLGMALSTAVVVQHRRLLAQHRRAVLVGELY